MFESARPATEADLAFLAAAAGDAVAEQRPERGGSVWSRREARAEPYEPSFADQIDADDGAVWVGEFDGVPVGYTAAHTEILREGAVLGVVDDIYVEPDARGVGVGAVLMDQILAWAVAQGCEGIDGLALPGNRETKNFFERFGFSARSLVVHHHLES